MTRRGLSNLGRHLPPLSLSRDGGRAAEPGPLEPTPLIARQGHPQVSPPLLAFLHVKWSYNTALASGTPGIYSTLENGPHQRMSPFSRLSRDPGSAAPRRPTVTDSHTRDFESFLRERAPWAMKARSKSHHLGRLKSIQWALLPPSPPTVSPH